MTLAWNEKDEVLVTTLMLMTMVKVVVNLMLINGGGDYLPAEECEKFKSSNEKKLTGKGSREGWKQ